MRGRDPKRIGIGEYPEGELQASRARLNLAFRVVAIAGVRSGNPI
jgi:hypothetical protein